MRKYEKEPCPFCGSTEVVVKHWGRENKMFVACKRCQACGPAKTYTEDAVKAWNAAKKRCDAIDKQAEENPLSLTHSCSVCGRALIVDSPNNGVNHAYCPGCGAEINPPRLF